MKEEQEKGRIAGWAYKRRVSYEYTVALLPLLKQARIELSDPEREISLRDIANWLNEHGARSIKGARFHAPTIQRILYHTGEHVRKFAKFEYDRAVAIAEYKRLPDRKERLAALDKTFREMLAESEALDRELAKIQRFYSPDSEL